MTEAVPHRPSDASQLGLPLPKMCYISKEYSKICELSSLYCIVSSLLELFLFSIVFFSIVIRIHSFMCLKKHTGEVFFLLLLLPFFFWGGGAV